MTAPAPGSFLDGLAPEDRAAFAAALASRRHPPRQVVIAHLDAGDDLHVILEGAAEVTLHGADGRQIAYRLLRPGDIFGELAAIDRGPRSASVVTRDAALIGTMPARRFEALLDDRPGLRLALLRHLSSSIRGLTERVFEMSALFVRQRLARELLRAAEAQANGAGEAVIRDPPTHFDLAARIGSHREAVSREMSELRRNGIVVREGAALRIRDLAKLAAVGKLS